VLAAAVAMAAAAGCGPRANPPGSAATLAPAAQVRSSIPDGAELSGPVRWEARVSGIPASGVAAVRFFIDGKLKYVARQAPYLFDGRRNLLLPGTLGPGSHVFAVDVTLTDGHRLTTAATAVVPAKARGTLRQVLGRWTRTVTAAQVARTRSFRNPADGIPLPAGTRQVRIGADGVARYTAPRPPTMWPSARCTSSPAGGWSPTTRHPTSRTHSRADSAPAPPAAGSTTGRSTAMRSPSGPSATINAPAATASGTAPSPGETPLTPRQRPQTPSITGDPAARTHQAGPPTQEET
jgi:hypothetical protein